MIDDFVAIKAGFWTCQLKILLAMERTIRKAQQRHIRISSEGISTPRESQHREGPVPSKSQRQLKRLARRQWTMCGSIVSSMCSSSKVAMSAIEYIPIRWWWNNHPTKFSLRLQFCSRAELRRISWLSPVLLWYQPTQNDDDLACYYRRRRVYFRDHAVPIVSLLSSDIALCWPRRSAFHLDHVSYHDPVVAPSLRLINLRQKQNTILRL